MNRLAGRLRPLARLPESEPRGWFHESFSLHRSWALRRAATYKLRATLIALVLLVPMAIISGWPVILLVSLVGLAYPVRVRGQTLREIERVYGSAYTTALVAPRDDAYGLWERLFSQARTVAVNAELPSWPWLEGVACVLLAALVFAWPGGVSFAPGSGAGGVTSPTTTAGRPGASGSVAQPVLGAPGQPSVKPGAGASGRTASAGSLLDEAVGRVQQGGGSAAQGQAPAEVSQQFLDDLKRRASQGALGLAAPSTGKAPSVKNLDAPTQSSSSGSAGRPGAGQAGAGSGKGGQAKPGAGANSQQGASQGQQNGKGRTGQGAGSGASAQGQGTGKGATLDSKGAGRRSGSGYDRHLDAGNNGGGPGGNDGAPGPLDTRAPGKGGHHAGGGVAQTGSTGNGSLQFLPGTVAATQARSGVLPLPGDPNSPWSAGRSSPAFQHAVESAVDDPRLPPEYQQLLRAYYR